MGVVLAKYDQTEFEHAKINPNPPFVHNDVRNFTSESSPFEYSVWQNLPSVVLVEVYKYLSSNDKFNLSLTCNTWSQTFTRPEVWRNSIFHFRFNGVDGWKALQCPTDLVPAMSHLVIKCQYEKSAANHSKELATTNLSNFLRRLVTINIRRLVTLRITINGDESSQYPWFSQDTILTLGELISMQTLMKHLELTRLKLDTVEGIDLLKTICTSCGSSINELSMDDFLRINVPPDSISWQNFSSLTDLTISQRYLSDLLLEALSVSGSLNLLTVMSNASTYFPCTSSDAWEQLTESCPSLETRFCFDQETSRGYYLYQVLIPGIPLVTLEFFGSSVGHYWNFSSNRIASYYENTLRKLVIRIQSRLVWKDDFLGGFIKRSVQLEEISLTVQHDILFLKADIVQSVQRCLANRPDSRMKRFNVNGDEIELCSTPPELCNQLSAFDN